MEFPKVNIRTQTSKMHQASLKLELLKTIHTYEKEFGYEFQSYEVDCVLLNIIQHHHKLYLKSKFGNDIID